MFIQKYKILVLNQSGKPRATLPMRAWMVPAVFLPLLALIACVLFLGKHFFLINHMERKLAAQDELLLDQRIELLHLASKIQMLEDSYEGINELNVKLRVMLQQEQLPWQDEMEMGIGGLGKMPLQAMLPIRKLFPGKLNNQCDSLKQSMLISEIYQQELISAIIERKDYFDHMPSIWPVKGRFSSGYGYRASPFTGKKEFHKGVDITAPRGTPIYAPAAGMVVFAGRFSTYGNSIMLDHETGIKTRFAHLYKIAVKKNQSVTRGELIGYVGNTGRSTASHLHYEVHVDDKVVNPMHYILN